MLHFEYTLRCKTTCLSTNVPVNRAGSLSVEVLAIRKLAYVVGERLAIVLRSARCGIYCHEVLRGWYDVAIFFTAIFPQLQLWRLYLFVSVLPVRDIIPKCHRCHTSCPTSMLLQSSKQSTIYVTSTRKM